MNTKSAIGFLVVGLMMKELPLLEPGWFPHNGPDGSNAGALWLMCMGLILAAVGAIHLLRHHFVPMIRRVGAYRARSRASRVAWRASRNPISGT
ncbi:MAG TPA: hypothetical protein VFE31_01190 [Opitutaceae bacterium]|jgi:hypothetical protein|nr:hypothetical protein [Opitutaceae bacterium]